MSEAKLKSITALLTSFPQSGTDREGFLKIMLAVLDDVSDESVRETAKRYAKGMVPRQSKTFAPTPAEFSSECRDWDKLQALKNRPRIAPPVTVRRGGYFERLKVKRDMYSGFPILFEGISYDAYRQMLARKMLPDPHFFVAHIGAIYSGLHPTLAGAKRIPRPHHEVAP
jgi:hypothetical protein